MKKQLLLLAMAIMTGASWSQDILFVDDNDNITDNSDTILAALSQTSYGTFTYFNVADSAATPGSDMLDTFDLVIWYASTDGVGLGFWNAGTGGDSELITYLVNGGKAWIIGSDLLYAGGYSSGSTFAAGDFTYDFMGLLAYNVQSYGNDGNAGVPQVDQVAGSAAYFPDSLLWTFPTQWWVDGVTSINGLDIYEMGPDSYPLANQVVMTHYTDGNMQVLSTFFDPALIDTQENRVDFIEQSVFYLLSFDLSVTEQKANDLTVFPNPAADQLTIQSENEENQPFELVSHTGTVVLSGMLSGKQTILDIAGLSSGMYFLQAGQEVQKIVIR